MKVLHLTEKYDSLTETFVRSFIEKNQTFAEVWVASFSVGEIQDTRFFELTTRSSYKNSSTLLRRILESFFRMEKWEKELVSLIASLKPDLIHCHFGTMGVLYNELDLKRKIQVPFATSFYGFDAFLFPKQYPSYLKALRKQFSNPKASFLVEGPAFKRQMLALGARDTSVLLNPLIVDTSFDRTKPLEGRSGMNFLLIGRFTEKKGFHLALEALGQLKEDLPAFRVSLIGFGKMEAAYKLIVKEHGLEEQVDFLGKKSHDEVKYALLNHDFFMHPSVVASDGDSEGGAPTIIIEAQAAGIPVIASNHADIPFVMGYHDFLGEEGDLDDLIRCIKIAINCDSLPKLVEKGKAHVSFQHDFIKSNQYESNLKEIINNFEVNT